MLEKYDSRAIAEGLPVPPIRISQFELTVSPQPLLLSPDDTTAAAAHFRQLAAGNPRLWNGSAFLWHRVDVDEAHDALIGEAHLTDYATFLHWRATPPEDRRFFHLFPVGAIVTADRRLIVGRMSDHTANAGKLYPPSGSFDVSDIVADPDGRQHLDPMANLLREIGEEIGLAADDLAFAPDWLLIAAVPRAWALVRLLQSPATSTELAPRLNRHVAEDPHQELSGIEFLSFDQRFDPTMVSGYVNELLAYLEANR